MGQQVERENETTMKSSRKVRNVRMEFWTLLEWQHGSERLATVARQEKRELGR